MNEKVSLATKTIHRIFLFFFIFLFVLELLGIAFIVSGLPGIYLFLNPNVLVLGSVILSCISSAIFALIDRNRTWKQSFNQEKR